MNALLYVSDHESEDVKAQLAALPHAYRVEADHIDGYGEFIVYGIELSGAVINLLAALAAARAVQGSSHIKVKGKTVELADIGEEELRRRLNSDEL